MRRLRLFVGMVATVGLALLTGPGSAWGGVVAHGRGFAGPPAPIIARPGPKSFPGFRRPFFFRRHFFPVPSTTVIVTSPFVSYPSPVDAAPLDASPAVDPPSSEVYAAPPAMALAPTPPPTPSVIEYPTGRYELRGDGVTTPYSWVWVPKPPPPPPAPPAGPPAALREVPDDPPAQPGEGQPPQASNTLYRWTDGQGVTHWTNMPNAIPERYRSPDLRPVQPGGDRV